MYHPDYHYVPAAGTPLEVAEGDAVGFLSLVALPVPEGCSAVLQICTQNKYNTFVLLPIVLLLIFS
jgi:hypothetical protein